MDCTNTEEIGVANVNDVSVEQNSAGIMLQEAADKKATNAVCFSLKITKKPIPSTPRGVLAE